MPHLMTIAILVALLLFLAFWSMRYNKIKRLICVEGKIKLSGKRVLVIGGSEGIGKAIAIEFTKEGADVTIAARRENTLQVAADDILKHVINQSQKISYQVIDVTESWENIRTTIDKIIESDGPFDILVNSAGFSDMRPLITLPMDRIEGMINCNLLGTIKITKAIIPHMIRQKFGQIVFVSSLCGQFSFFGCSGYSASKFGISGFADAISMELKHHNIGITIIFPADTDTPGFEHENLTKSPIAEKISSQGGVYKPETVSQKAIKAIKNRQYWCTYGFNGYIVGILSQDCSPRISLMSIIISIFSFIIRLAFYWSLSDFYEISAKMSQVEE